MVSKSLSLEPKCVAVVKHLPSDRFLKEVEARYVDKTTSSDLQKLYVLPVDIPVSILY